MKLCYVSLGTHDVGCRSGQNSLSGQCRTYHLDLANLESVSDFVSKWKKPIDILVCNAGIWGLPTLTFAKDSGLELALATNHLGHFALVVGLLNQGKLASNCHILVVSSSLHNPKDGNGRMGGPNFDFDDLKWKNHEYDPRIAYQNSKLANIWFVYELDRILREKQSGIRINAICPGFVPTTRLSRNAPFFLRIIMKTIFPLLPFTVSLDQASQWMIDACLNETDSGKLFSKGQITKSSEESYDQDKARKLWKLSSDLSVKLNF